FEVAMHHSGLMGCCEAAPGRNEDGHHITNGTLALVHPLRERGAFDQLHREEDAIFINAGIEDGDDVRMVYASDRLRLAKQTRMKRLTKTRSGRVQTDHLERHLAIELRILGAVDDARGACTERPEDDVAADRRSLSEPPVAGERRSAGVAHLRSASG